MSVKTKINDMFFSLQNGAKLSSRFFLLWTLKIFVAFVFGLTIALIGEEVFKYQMFSYYFVLLMTSGVFLKLTKSWQFIPVVIFILFYIMLAMLLRMYIFVAPGI